MRTEHETTPPQRAPRRKPLVRARGGLLLALATLVLLAAACGARSVSPAPAVESDSDARARRLLAASLDTIPRRPAESPARAERGEATAAPVVLVPSDDAEVTAALADGLRAAFDEARRAGGPDLALRVADAPGRWGSQVEEAVRLAVDGGAVALVAPPERRHAHLLAQLASKVRLPMLSTARDPRVDAAGSTWVVPVAAPLPLEDARAIDGLPPPPAFDPPAPRPWERVGLDAGRRLAAAVRARGVDRLDLVHGLRGE